MTGKQVALSLYANNAYKLSEDSRQDIALVLLKTDKVFACLDDGLRYAMRALAYRHKRAHYRASKLQQLLMLEYPLVERNPVDIADRIGLRQAMDSLPMRIKRIIKMYYWQDMTIAEIAMSLDVSASMVSMTLTRARRWLSSKMDK